LLDIYYDCIVDVNVSEYISVKKEACNVFKSEISKISNEQKRPIIKDVAIYLTNKERFYIDKNALAMRYSNRHLRNVVDYSRRYGVKYTAQLILAHSLGMKTYSAIKYPVNDIEVMVRPNIFWKELENNQWEPNSMKFLADVVTERSTILDIGAWIGQYTLLCSKLMNNTGRVLAFEPDPKAYEVLVDNVKKNKLTNIHVEKMCVSNFVGRAKLTAEEFGQSLSSTRGKAQKEHLQEVFVETITLDSYCSDNRVKPDGIKIDVEGTEASVVEGAMGVIEKFAPWVLLEFHALFMSEEERRINWQKITAHAKKIIFLEGDTYQYKYRDEVTSMPKCPVFRVFIKN
jgi:FkbM family methyltransferase